MPNVVPPLWFPGARHDIHWPNSKSPPADISKPWPKNVFKTPFCFLNVWLLSRFSKVIYNMLPCHWWCQLPGHPVQCTSASLVRRDKRWTTTTAKYFQTPVRLPKSLLQHPRWLAHKSINHNKSKGMRRIYGKLMISNLCWMIGNADVTCRRIINEDHQTQNFPSTSSLCLDAFHVWKCRWFPCEMKGCYRSWHGQQGWDYHFNVFKVNRPTVANGWELKCTVLQYVRLSSRQGFLSYSSIPFQSWTNWPGSQE